MKIYLVGGAVRDRLIDYPVLERDWVVVGASPDELLDLGYQQVGADFPVFLHPQSREEYALARTERKSGHGYAGFNCYSGAEVTLEEDLLRRDLTINAMAEDEAGNIIDPYGGQSDLKRKLLRHVSPAFSEDPLRVLRVARFAARYHHLGFHIADETLSLMRDIVDAGEMQHLVAERIWKELDRALAERSPSIFFETLRHCGALAEIMPELDNLFGVPQPEVYHPEIDTGVHSLLSLTCAAAASDNSAVRFAALIHDLGKACSPPENWPHHHGHETAGLKPIKALCERLKTPKEYQSLALKVCEFHTHCHRAPELKPSTLMKVLKALDALRRPQALEDFLQACQADARGRTGFENVDYPQAALFRRCFAAAEQVNASTLMAEGYAGKALGEALDRERIKAIALAKAKAKNQA